MPITHNNGIKWGSVPKLTKKMLQKLSKIGITLSLLALFGGYPSLSAAIPVDGNAVTTLGGAMPAGSVNGAGQTEYFIPLGPSGLPAGTLPGGIYGTPAIFCGDVGTCQDSGTGIGYTGADALFMNIHFDLTAEPDIVGGTMDFTFIDLDLMDVNDPVGFFESVSLAWWDGVGLNSVNHSGGSVYDHTSELADVGTITTGGMNDPITWSLDLASLGVVGLINATDNLWIQLGFGSNFCSSGQNPLQTDPHAHDYCDKWGKNTPEYLAVELNVSPVPVPSAVWLFGSALLGFIGMSRRTRV